MLGIVDADMKASPMLRLDAQSAACLHHRPTQQVAIHDAVEPDVQQHPLQLPSVLVEAKVKATIRGDCRQRQCYERAKLHQKLLTELADNLVRFGHLLWQPARDAQVAPCTDELIVQVIEPRHSKVEANVGRLLRDVLRDVASNVTHRHVMRGTHAREATINAIMAVRAACHRPEMFDGTPHKAILSGREGHCLPTQGEFGGFRMGVERNRLEPKWLRMKTNRLNVKFRCLYF